MSPNNDTFNPFDPTGMLKGLRDANLDAWSKLMIECVNTDAYAKATGAMLDSCLSKSAPLRQALEAAVTRALTGLNMPTRDDVIGLAERLTNIELRLDDMDAKLDEFLRAAAPKARHGAKTKPANGEGQS